MLGKKPQSYLLPSLSLVLCAVVLTACRDSRVSTYEAPKDALASKPAPALDVSSAAPAPQIRWQAPAHWQSSAPANSAAASVRAGSFTITATDGSGRNADMAITTFPGDVGGDLANINRWRGQLKLAPITAAELTSAYTTVAVPAGEFLLADMTGAETPAKRTLGAWLKQPAQNRTWFFKLTGDAALVAAEREAFLAFLKTVTFAP